MDKIEKEQAKEWKAFIGNVRTVMKTSAGKEVVSHILGMTGIYDRIFTGNSQTFFLEGKREIGLDIVDLLNEADPTIYPRLQLEQAKNQGVHDE